MIEWLSGVIASIGAWFEDIARQFVMTVITADRYKLLLEGLGRTLTIALTAAVIGVILGSVLALMNLSRSRLLKRVSALYVGLIRGTPVVVQLLIMYHIILVSVKDALIVAIITFGLNSAAYVSEMVRGGILAVDKGQTEAGRSLGLSQTQTMLRIVLPQAVKIVIPSWFNEFIMLLKETSIAGYVGLMDLAKSGDFIRSRTFSAFMPFLVVAAIYLMVVSFFTVLFKRLERRLRQSDLR